MRRRAPVPWHFCILNLSHGVVFSGITGTLLAYLLRQQGLTPHAIANESSFLILPGTLFFLWSPITDFLLRRRTWLLLSSAVASVAVMVALQMKSYASVGAVTLLFTASLPDSAGFRGNWRHGGVVDALRAKDTRRVLSASG